VNTIKKEINYSFNNIKLTKNIILKKLYLNTIFENKHLKFNEWLNNWKETLVIHAFLYISHINTYYLDRL